MSQPWILAFELLFFFGSLVFLLAAWASLLVVLRGANIVFDRSRQTISRNGRQLASFGDILEVKITERSSGESDTYPISLTLRDGRSISLDSGSDYNRMAEAAADIGGILGAKVVLPLRGRPPGQI